MDPFGLSGPSWTVRLMIVQDNQRGLCQGRGYGLSDLIGAGETGKDVSDQFTCRVQDISMNQHERHLRRPADQIRRAEFRVFVTPSDSPEGKKSFPS
jgi:hypothetical protein